MLSATTGGWETVYWLDGEGALVLPQQVLASYRLPAGGTVQVGTGVAPSRWSCGPARRGEATVSPGGLLRVPLAVWGRTGNAAGPLLAGAAALPPDAVSGRQGPPIKKGPRRGPLLCGFVKLGAAFKKFSRGGEVHALFVCLQELEQLLPDDGHAPGAVAFQVDGQNGGRGQTAAARNQPSPSPLGKDTRIPSRLSGAMAQFCSWAYASRAAMRASPAGPEIPPR